jgi:hypothetical protein
LEGVCTLCAFNARSDKTNLSGIIVRKGEFAAVRMLVAPRADLAATFPGFDTGRMPSNNFLTPKAIDHQHVCQVSTV